jgi:hypothetical protein
VGSIVIVVVVVAAVALRCLVSGRSSLMASSCHRMLKSLRTFDLNINTTARL